MARKQTGINWETKELMTSIAELGPRIERGLAVTGGKIAADGEAWMKSNAPWNDVTGNARSGLRGTYGGPGGGRDSGGRFTAGGGGAHTHRVVFSHSMDYGIWLEIRFEARNAIIMPAVEKFSVEWAALLSRLLKVGG